MVSFCTMTPTAKRVLPICLLGLHWCKNASHRPAYYSVKQIDLEKPDNQKYSMSVQNHMWEPKDLSRKNYHQSMDLSLWMCMISVGSGFKHGNTIVYGSWGLLLTLTATWSFRLGLGFLALKILFSWCWMSSKCHLKSASQLQSIPTHQHLLLSGSQRLCRQRTKDAKFFRCLMCWYRVT